MEEVLPVLKQCVKTWWMERTFMLLLSDTSGDQTDILLQVFFFKKERHRKGQKLRKGDNS